MAAPKLRDQTRIKNLIIKGSKLGFTARELGRAFELSHSAILYYIWGNKKRKFAKVGKQKR